ncbi:arginine--tRNA ligase [Buchnera aphidicola (Mindarus keteleerifoliae)]|uniref:arginine--tRNA ligase n=1 Tax=Buchnera aphidicola TaxID=9 RepID=UPI0031B73053
MNLKSELSKIFKKALIDSCVSFDHDLGIKKSSKNQKSDYQVNGLINISKKMHIDPYELSNKIILKIKKKKFHKKIEIIKPGLITIILSKKWLEEKAEKMFSCSRLNIVNTKKPKTIVVDYSSPNVAKEMHVGHLRSTIIGDVLVRVLKYLGHKVIKVNHIGDWGIQFGMLIAFMLEKKIDFKEKIDLKKLEIFYQKAKKKYEINNNFARKSKNFTCLLQKKESFCIDIWKKIVDITVKYNQEIYKKLNVSLLLKDVKGESQYNDHLRSLVKDLIKKNIAVKKNGSIIVYLNEFKNRNGKTMGVIIRKKDKSYLYSTIDIACLKYRCQTLLADRIVYYTDSRQEQHLKQVTIIAKKAGYVPLNVLIEHHVFGMILSKKKQPFKTRTGDNIKLTTLINKAIEKSTKIIKEKNPKISKKELNNYAPIIGIGALKYFDLSKNRNNNYIFDWEQILSFEGNTAPYIQYAYTRIISILKKSKLHKLNIKEKICLKKEIEKKLIIQLLEFEEIILNISKHGKPHIMCLYLYELSSIFSSFYETCPIIFAKKKKIFLSRIKLSILTSKVIKKGLNLLGIKTIEKM